MSALLILGYRVPFGREMKANASMVEREARRLGLKARAVAVSEDTLELWLVDPEEPALGILTHGFKGVDFTGEVSREDSRAAKVVAAERSVGQTVASKRAPAWRFRDKESEAVDSWWSATRDAG